MKSIIGNGSCNSKRELQVTKHNETVSDRQTIANECNHVLPSIGYALADTITCSVDPMYMY